MAKAQTASAPSKAAAPAAAPAPAAAGEPGTGAVPAPSSSETLAGRPRRQAPAEKPAAELSPTEQIKADKKNFAERMQRAKKAVALKAAAAKGETPATEEPASGKEAEGTASDGARPSVSGKTPRQLLEAGDIDSAFEAAFGKKPHDFKIDSRRWEEWRKAGIRQKQALETKRKEDTGALDAERRNVEQTIARAKQVYGPMVEAKKLFEAGDVMGAVQAAFGVDINGLQKRALAQFHGKNPEIEKLRAEIQEEKRARAELEQAQRSKADESALAERRAAHKQKIKATLAEGGDPEIAELANRPGFVHRVFQIQAQHYDADTDETVTIEDAAAMARQEILTEFGAVLGRSAHRSESAESVQAGSKPANAKNGHRPPSRTLSQRGAVEASEPGRALTQQERLRKYTDLAKAERG
jgi:hypothetical protein